MPPQLAKAALCIGYLLSFIAVAFALDFPALTGRIVDQAGIIDGRMRQDLEQKLAALEAKSGDQLVVVTLKSLQGTSIEDFGYQLGRHWQIGQAGKNNGVLLIIAPNERKVRIEVGYGLEGTLTDAITRLIIENAVLPRFRVNDYSGGISRAVDDVIDVLSGDAEEWKRRAATRPEAPDWVGVLTTVLFFLVILAMAAAAANQDRRARRDGRRSGTAWGPDRRGSRGWGGGGWAGGGWGGGGGGGGFSGGGGSFGGGGASGSW